jgi:hypothetical protein
MFIAYSLADRLVRLKDLKETSDMTIPMDKINPNPGTYHNY